MLRINDETVQWAKKELAEYDDDPEWDDLSRNEQFAVDPTRFLREGIVRINEEFERIDRHVAEQRARERQSLAERRAGGPLHRDQRTLAATVLAFVKDARYTPEHRL